MSAYPPPKENLPIYNPTDFEYENFPLTIQDAKDFFLEYPTAQGAETLSSIIVNGASTFNDVATINDSLDIIQPTSSLNALNIQNDNPGTSITATSKTNQSTAGKLNINGSSTAIKECPIVQAGDSVISTNIGNNYTQGGLVLATRGNTFGQGIRLNYISNELYGYTRILDGGQGGDDGILGFPDGTQQTTAYNPNIANWSQEWRNGNWYALGSAVPYNIPQIDAFINMPNLQSGDPLNQYSGTNLMLEITYNITGFVSGSTGDTELCFTGYNMITINISETGVFSIFDVLAPTGSMRTSRAITINGTGYNFIPYTIDYTNQTNKNGIEVSFAGLSTTGAFNSITGYNRSIRIVNGGPGFNLTGTYPTQSNAGFDAYFTTI
mgnify:CR=1 FL=1